MAKYTEPIQNQPPMPTGADANGGKNLEPEAKVAKKGMSKFTFHRKKPAKRARGMF